MGKQAERKTKFDAVVEIRMDIDILKGAVGKDEWTLPFGMVTKIVKDMLPRDARSEFRRAYGDGLQLKVRVTDIACDSVSERDNK